LNVARDSAYWRIGLWTHKKGKIMKFGQSSKTVLAYLWKLPLCAFAYMAGTMVGGALVSGLGMALPKFPEQADEKTMGLCDSRFATARTLAIA
jgi:hypothetical protein